jgi:hypothetical protein
MISEKKNIVLFIGSLNSDHFETVKELEKHLNRKLKVGLITTLKKKIKPEIEKKLDIFLRCDMEKGRIIEETLRPYHDDILLITAKFEFSIELLARLVSYFPYLRLPTKRSLKIANDKLEMRKAFTRYYPKITPKFIYVKKYSDAILKEIKEKIGFPCVIKPTNLSTSKLIVNCYYQEELEKDLKEVFRKVSSLYKKADVEVEPKIIVEQFMEGQMYTIDAYVNSLGKIYYTPIIEVKTGKDAGYDDFFMYTQITPSILSKTEEMSAHDTVEKAIHAVGLRSTTVHCELMKTSKGFQVIELAARCGGFREELLFNSFGIKHGLNDFLIHLGKKPVIKTTKNNHTVLIKFWPHKKGKLVGIKGLIKAKQLNSLVKFRQGVKMGEYAGLSKHGHTYVIAFTLSTPTRSELLADIRRLEKWIIIETNRNGVSKK